MTIELKLFATWEASPLLDEHLWANVKANRNLHKLCPVERKMKYVCKDKTHYLFLEENYWSELEKWCGENVENIEFFRRELRDFNTTAEIVKRRIDRITHVKAPLLSDEELAAVYNKTVEQINSITPFDQFGMIVEPIFTQKLARIIGKEKIADATMPPRQSTTIKEELAVVNAALEILKNGNNFTVQEIIEKYGEKIENLVSTYGYIPVFSFNQSWDKTHYAKELGEKVKIGREKLEKKKSELENFEETTRQKIKLATTNTDSHIPEIIQVLTFTRNEAELVLSYGNYKLQQFYKEIAKRLGISITQMRYYTQEELTRAVIERKADETLLNNRIANGVGIYTDVHVERLLSESEIDELMKVVGKKSGATQELMCACQGKAGGKVRIVRNADDVNNFKEGEILIALWTCVDFLPAMKKASAFITEGGGITSHASVIAREFNVPCIIGYKDATQLFKNGDEIEIDAIDLKVKKVTN